MSGFIINPYRYAGASFPHYAACDGGNTDLYDPDAIASAGTFTVPSQWNGRYVRFSAALFSNVGASSFTMTKNGSAFDGKGSLAFPATSGGGSEDGGSICSAPLTVSTGDTFASSSADNFKCLEVLPSSVKVAVVNRITSSFSISAATETAIDWNNELVDTDSWHDNSTNPSRLTVPTGVSMVRVSCNVVVAASGGDIRVRLFKNGSAISPDIQAETTASVVSLMSPPISCSSTDYFEVKVTTTSATSVSVDNASWFAIESVDSSINYAVAKRSSNTTIVNGGSPLAIAMDTEVTDVGGWFTANQSKFVVPSGITRIRCGFCTNKTSAVGSYRTWMAKGSGSTSVVDGYPGSAQNGAGIDYTHAVSSILEVTAGDEINFVAQTDAGAQNMLANSFFWIEEVAAVTS